MRAEILGHKSDTLHALGRNRDALDAAKEACACDPKRARAFVALAVAYDALGEPMKALDEIQNGLKGDPKAQPLFEHVLDRLKPKLQACTALKEAAERGNLEECRRLADKLDGFGFPTLKSICMGERVGPRPFFQTFERGRIDGAG